LPDEGRLDDDDDRLEEDDDRLDEDELLPEEYDLPLPAKASGVSVKKTILVIKKILIKRLSILFFPSDFLFVNIAILP
jgi:hypothetical protein